MYYILTKWQSNIKMVTSVSRIMMTSSWSCLYHSWYWTHSLTTHYNESLTNLSKFKMKRYSYSRMNRFWSITTKICRKVAHATNAGSNAALFQPDQYWLQKSINGANTHASRTEHGLDCTQASNLSSNQSMWCNDAVPVNTFVLERSTRNFQ